MSRTVSFNALQSYGQSQSHWEVCTAKSQSQLRNESFGEAGFPLSSWWLEITPSERAWASFFFMLGTEDMSQCLWTQDLKLPPTAYGSSSLDIICDSVIISGLFFSPVSSMWAKQIDRSVAGRAHSGHRCATGGTRRRHRHTAHPCCHRGEQAGRLLPISPLR